MPFKNNKRNNGFAKTNKQKKKIKKKLMNISLIVDYYIYKNRPISVADATSYYHEVISYQAICKHDERSLQVIEKLSRFMLAIIEEQSGHVVSETNFSGAYTQPFDNDRVSPTYSMTEEDRIELKIIGRQFNNETVSFTEPQHKTSGVCENSHKSTLFLKTLEDISVSVVDVLSNKPYVQTVDEKDDLVDEIVSMIDLSLNEREICSPSILNNLVVSETQNIIIQNSYADQCGQDITEVDRVVNDLLKEDKSKATLENNGGKSIVTNTIADESPDFQIEALETLKIKNVQNELTDTSATRQVNKQGKSDYIKPAKQRKLQNSTENIKKTKQNSTENVRKPKQNSNVTMRKTKNTNKSTNNKGRRNKLNYKTKNDNESDLSWIENIKFVRQINIDEYEPNTLGESFWENCDLPISWDDFD